MNAQKCQFLEIKHKYSNAMTFKCGSNLDYWRQKLSHQQNCLIFSPNWNYSWIALFTRQTTLSMASIQLSVVSPQHAGLWLIYNVLDEYEQNIRHDRYVRCQPSYLLQYIPSQSVSIVFLKIINLYLLHSICIHQTK